MTTAEQIQGILHEQWGVPELDPAWIQFEQQPIPKIRHRIPLFRKSYCQVYWTPEGRLIQYTPRDRLLFRKTKGRWQVAAEFADKELMVQVCRTFWLSVFGMKQELAGQLRLHAAGVSNEEDCVLFWGPPGSGKTTLTQLAIRATGHRILGDELCLFDGEDIQGIALALHQKRTDESDRRIEKIPAHRLQGKARAKTLYVLQTKRSTSQVVADLGWIEKLQIAGRLWIGEGLHQMAEYHLSFQNLPELFQLGLNRIFLLWRFLSTIQVKKLSAPDFKNRTDIENQIWMQKLLKSHLCADE